MNQTNNSSTKTNIKYIIYLLILIGGLLRIYGIEQKSLWVDELASINVSKDTHLLLNYCAQRNTPPLRNLLIHYLTQLKLIRIEALVRLPSAIAGIISIYLIFLFAKILVNEKVGIIAAILLTFSPWHIFHSQDARMYSVVMCLGLASSICILKGLSIREVISKNEGNDSNQSKKGNWLYWIFFAIFNAINAYISYFGIFIIIAQYFFILLNLIIRYFSEKSLKAVTKILSLSILSGLIMFLIYLPWLIYSPKDVKDIKVRGVLLKVLDQYGITTGETPIDQETQIQGDEIARGPGYNPFGTQYNLQYFSNLFSKFGSEKLRWIYLIFFISGLIISFFRYKQLFLFTITLVIVPIIILLLTNASWFFPPRYLSYEMFIYLTICAVGINGLLKIIKDRNIISAGHKILTVILLLILIIFNSIEIFGYYKAEKQDWKGLAKYLETNVQDGDTIIAGAYWTSLGILQYVEDYSKNVNLVVDCMYEEDFVVQVYQPKRIWYVNWGPIPDFIYRHINNNMSLVKEFPGMLGTIQVYKKEPTQFDYEMYEKIKDHLDTLKRQ